MDPCKQRTATVVFLEAADRIPLRIEINDQRREERMLFCFLLDCFLFQSRRLKLYSSIEEEQQNSPGLVAPKGHERALLLELYG